MISAVDAWTFVHILLFVYWLGADLGVFIAAQAAKRSTLTYPQRSTALQLALKVDVAPRLSFALMFACGLELAAAKGFVEPAGWQRALAWAASIAWVSFVIGMVRFEGRPVAAFCKHANEWLHIALFVVFGALGLALRKVLYPLLLGSVGKGVVFGQNVVLRHPHKIRLGDGVTVDDLVVLDAKGASNRGIDVGRFVFLGRGTILSCKDGDITIGDHGNFGFHCEVFSGSSVVVGKHGLFAAQAYLVGGGHEFAQGDRAVIDQPRTSRGIVLGDNVWLGTGAKVLDGVRIGSDVVVGANAVVNADLPDGAVAAGVPARVLRSRAD